MLREGEVWRLIDATLPSYRAIVTLLAWSGLRVSEAIGLRWRDVDFVDGLFHFEEQLAPPQTGRARFERDSIVLAFFWRLPLVPAP